MKLKIFKDSIAAAAAKVVAACLPFLTIGMLGSDVTAIVSGIVGAVALVTLIVRAVMLLGKTEARTIASLDGTVSDILSFPLCHCPLIADCNPGRLRRYSRPLACCYPCRPRPNSRQDAIMTH